MWKRFLSLNLALIMVLSLLPGQVGAVQTAAGDGHYLQSDVWYNDGTDEHQLLRIPFTPGTDADLRLYQRIPDFQRPGRVVVGYNTQADGLGTQYTLLDHLTDAMPFAPDSSTLYAAWADAPDHSVRYLCPTEDGTDYYIQSGISGSVRTPEQGDIPFAEGAFYSHQQLVGWTCLEDETLSCHPGETVAVDRNLRMIPRFAMNYVVLHDGEKEQHLEPPYGPEKLPNKDKDGTSVFLGWNDRPDGSGTWYYEITKDTPHHLYAQYKSYPAEGSYVVLRTEKGLESGRLADILMLDGEGKVVLPENLNNGETAVYWYWREKENKRAYLPGEESSPVPGEQLTAMPRENRPHGMYHLIIDGAGGLTKTGSRYGAGSFGWNYDGAFGSFGDLMLWQIGNFEKPGQALTGFTADHSGNKLSLLEMGYRAADREKVNGVARLTAGYAPFTGNYILYDGNGALTPEGNTYLLADGLDFTQPGAVTAAANPFVVPEGKFFDGWRANGKRYVPGDAIDFSENTVAAASWLSDKATYYRADGTLYAVREDEGKVIGFDYDKKPPMFAGWNTSPDGSGQWYLPGDPLPCQAIELYEQIVTPPTDRPYYLIFGDQLPSHRFIEVHEMTGQQQEIVLPEGTGFGWHREGDRDDGKVADVGAPSGCYLPGMTMSVSSGDRIREFVPNRAALYYKNDGSDTLPKVSYVCYASWGSLQILDYDRVFGAPADPQTTFSHWSDTSGEGGREYAPGDYVYDSPLRLYAIMAREAASLNGQVYMKLEEALQAARAGDTVILLRDHRGTKPLEIPNMDLTIQCGTYRLDHELIRTEGLVTVEGTPGTDQVVKISRYGLPGGTEECSLVSNCTRSSFQLNDLPLVDENGSPLTVMTDEGGILQLVDGQGMVWKESDRVYCSQDWETKAYSVGYSWFENAKGVPAGTYDLRLLADTGAIYRVGHQVRVLDETTPHVWEIYVNNQRAGDTEVELMLSTAGVTREEQLDGIRLRLMKDGQPVGYSTGRYELCNDRGQFIFPVSLLPGLQLEADQQYEFQASYEGPGELLTTVDGGGMYVSAEGHHSWARIRESMFLTSDPAVARFEIEDAMPGCKYRIEVRDQHSSLSTFAVWEGSFAGKTGKVDLKLLMDGRETPAYMLPQGMRVLLREVESGEELQNNYLNNPDGWLTENQTEVSMDCTYIHPDDSSVPFEISLNRGDTLLQADGSNVVTLTTVDGRELGRCDLVTVKKGRWEDEYRLTGVLNLTERVKSEGEYQYRLNGVPLSKAWGVDWLNVDLGDTPTIRNGQMFFNLGEMPVEIRAFNGSGSGQLWLCSQNTGKKVAEATLQNTLQDTYTRNYRYRFVFDSFVAQKMADGERYYFVFRDGGGKERPVWGEWNRAYDGNMNTGSLRNMVDFNWRALLEGATSLTSTGLGWQVRNLDSAGLEVLREIALEGQDTGEIIPVTAITQQAYDWETDNWPVTITFAKGLEPGQDYRVLLRGEQLDYLSEARERIYDTAEPGVPKYLRGEGLRTDGTYTAKLYRDGVCLTETPFPMTLEKNTGDDRLWFDPNVIAWESGIYRIRVFVDGNILGEVSLSYTEGYSEPIPVLMEAQTGGQIGGLARGGALRINLVNAGTYGFMRWSEDRSALEGKPFVAHMVDPWNDCRYDPTAAEDGPRTLYVECSRSGQDGDPENLIRTVEFYYCGNQGIQLRQEEGRDTVAASAATKFINVWASFRFADGQTEVQRLKCLGQRPDGRWSFSLPEGLLKDGSFENQYNGEIGYFRDALSVEVFATTQRANHDGDERGEYRGEFLESCTGSELLQGSITIQGEAAVGQILTAQANITVSADRYEIRWYRNGMEIPGAVGSTYEITGDDRGCSITARAVGLNGTLGGISSENTVIVPVTAPDAPEVTVIPGDGMAVLTWQAPADGGKPITGYIIKKDGVVLAEVDADTTRLTVPGVERGTEAVFTVEAVNEVGGTPSAENSVTPAEDGVNYPVTVTSGEKDELEISIESHVPGRRTVRAMAAIYDGDGRMLSVSEEEVELTDDGPVLLTVPAEKNKEARYAKVFILDQEYILPLQGSSEAELNTPAQ